VFSDCSPSSIVYLRERSLGILYMVYICIWYKGQKNVLLTLRTKALKYPSMCGGDTEPGLFVHVYIKTTITRWGQTVPGLFIHVYVQKQLLHGVCKKERKSPGLSSSLV